MSADEPYTPFTGRTPGPSATILIERLWRLRLVRTGRVLSCGLYRTTAGLELRCDYGGDDLIRSQVASDLGTAGELAATWKMTALAKAGFLELEA